MNKRRRPRRPHRRSPEGLSAFLRAKLQQSLAFGTLIVLVIFFSIASSNFFSWSNISSILLATAVIGILALGTTFVIITGGIDLSIGTGMTLCAVMTGIFLVNMQLPLIVGVIGGLLTGCADGLHQRREHRRSSSCRRSSRRWP